jgi:hypothetical protein
MALKRKVRLAELEEQIMLAKAAAPPNIQEFRRGAQISLPDLGPMLVPTATIPASPAPPRRPPTSGRVPYDVALRQITRVVVAALNEYGEQWDDGCRQDLISTLFIAATKDKKISFPFDEEAA